MRRMIKLGDVVEITYYIVRIDYSGARMIQRGATSRYDNFASISEIGLFLTLSRKINNAAFHYVSVHNISRNWYEEYNVSQFGTMSVRKAQY